MELKTDPKYGYYPWWPEDGDGWVHPEDVAIARGAIPGPRIFRRDGVHGDYVVLHYGDLRLRVRPTLWQEVPFEGFNIGDWVEVMSRGQLNAFRTGVITEMQWDAHSHGIRYLIHQNGVPIPTRYAAEDLRHVEPTA
ncbi:MAG: hypothetical protein DCC67_06810 [Planctomycetota bacterium]|nr:MAG: hypothetical protein DCC67_06810 [Planctomycetota bacterium]